MDEIKDLMQAYKWRKKYDRRLAVTRYLNEHAQTDIYLKRLHVQLYKMYLIDKEAVVEVLAHTILFRKYDYSDEMVSWAMKQNKIYDYFNNEKRDFHELVIALNKKEVAKIFKSYQLCESMFKRSKKS